MINEKSFDQIVQGKQVGLYTIGSDNGLKAQITNYGAKIVTLFVSQADGTTVDVVLGFKTLDEWLTKEVYFNGINGRVAGRISNAQAEIDGQTFHFTQNQGQHTLHGGNHGFNDKVSASEAAVRPKITLASPSKTLLLSKLMIAPSQKTS